jgi:hypothetical protein
LTGALLVACAASGGLAASVGKFPSPKTPLSSCASGALWRARCAHWRAFVTQRPTCIFFSGTALVAGFSPAPLPSPPPPLRAAGEARRLRRGAPAPPLRGSPPYPAASVWRFSVRHCRALIGWVRPRSFHYPQRVKVKTSAPSRGIGRDLDPLRDFFRARA